MSDYLGPNQTRVLDSDYRNFEGVVYQKRKPPLSSEATFCNKLAFENSRINMATLIPSGWLIVGTVRDEESEQACFAGDVMCSPDFSANSFKIICADKGTMRNRLVAIVNGWHLLVQGSVMGDIMDSLESNHIVLSAPGNVGTRVDFVFLEVWRKLITPTDTIYKYGNVLYGGTNWPNDLIDPATNYETSLRIQIQYRIRTISGIRSEYYPEGFDPLAVYAQGAKSIPQNCSQCNFVKMDTDPGLWRAGNGDDASKEILGTVDGYSYAIPMFMIRRRNTTAYNPDTNANGAGYSQSDYRAGWSSDRPDGLYNNMIVADDILDLRHLVGASESYKEICDVAFRKFISGQARTVMAKSVLGGNSYGPVILKADAISSTDLPGSEGIGVNGDGTRRMFVNAQIDQPYTFVLKTVNDKQSGIPGQVWLAGNTVRVSVNAPAGSVIQSIDAVRWVYTDNTLSLSHEFSNTFPVTPAATIDLTIKTGSYLINTTRPFTIQYTIRYAQGSNGFRDLPDTFFESGPISRSIFGGNSFALPNNDIPVRGQQAYIAGDYTGQHMLTNKLWADPSTWNFGHQLVYYPSSSGPTFTIPRNLFGYDIMGVANVTVNGADTTVSAISRTSSTYTVTLGTSGRIGVTLYTGGKFFNVSAQGRGITETYEMVNMTPVNAVDGTNRFFYLDSTNQRLLAFASLHQDNGYGYCYLNGTLKGINDPVNKFHAGPNGGPSMPDTTQHRTMIWFDTAPSAGSTVEVPVLMNSAVTASAGQQIFYKMIPYQGLLDTTSVTGCVKEMGPAIVTTAGSGSVTPQATNLTNIIDRMPTLDSGNDCSGNYSQISRADTSLDTTLDAHVVSRVQDIMDRPQGTAIIGLTSADRGRAGVVLPGAPLSGMDGKPYLGLKFNKLSTYGSFQKTYQSYLLDKDCSGELYLMVVGSESDTSVAERCLTYYSGKDTVDIFRIPGRPLTLRR